MKVDYRTGKWKTLIFCPPDFTHSFQPGSDAFMNQLALPFGVGDSFTESACDITERDCPVINCGDLQDNGGTADSAAAYMVMHSFDNFARAMANLYSDLQEATQSFDNTEVWFQQTFSQDTSSASSTGDAILIAAIQAAIGIFAALLGPIGPGVAASAGAVVGAAGGVNGAITALLPQTPRDTSLQDLAAIEL